MERNDPPGGGPTPFDAFENLARRVIAVPKEVIDKREAEYQRKRAKLPKRGPKPGPKAN
jgi:hypothetical protein